MGESSKSGSEGWLSRQVEHISDWFERDRLHRELETLSLIGELDAVLADAGLTRSDLPLLLEHDPEEMAGLEQMAQRLGIAPEQLTAAVGRHDLQWRCLTCDDKKLCKRWLADHESAEAAPDFCPNAVDLNAIRSLVAEIRTAKADSAKP